jgi:hypothetical protein
MEATELPGLSPKVRKDGSYMSLGVQAAAYAKEGVAEGIPPEPAASDWLAASVPEPETETETSGAESSFEEEGSSEDEDEEQEDEGATYATCATEQAEVFTEGGTVVVEPQSQNAFGVSGTGEWQIDGKGKFHQVQLALIGLDLTVTALKAKGKGSGVLSRGSVQGCTLSKPKSERKGHPHCLRIDLEQPREAVKGLKLKFLLSVIDQIELVKWTSALVQHSHMAAEVNRTKSKGPAFLQTVLPTVDLDSIRHKVWRAYIASLSKEEQKLADVDLRRGTSVKANTAAKRACELEFSALRSLEEDDLTSQRHVGC